MTSLYRLVATRKGKTCVGTCKPKGRGVAKRIVCIVVAPRNQTWSVRATARGASGTELAERLRTLKSPA